MWVRVRCLEFSPPVSRAHCCWCGVAGGCRRAPRRASTHHGCNSRQRRPGAGGAGKRVCVEASLDGRLLWPRPTRVGGGWCVRGRCKPPWGGARRHVVCFREGVATANLRLPSHTQKTLRPGRGLRQRARTARCVNQERLITRTHAGTRHARPPQMAAPLAVRRMAPADVLAFNAVNLDYFTETVSVCVCVCVCVCVRERAVKTKTNLPSFSNPFHSTTSRST